MVSVALLAALVALLVVPARALTTEKDRGDLCGDRSFAGEADHVDGGTVNVSIDAYASRIAAEQASSQPVVLDAADLTLLEEVGGEYGPFGWQATLAPVWFADASMPPLDDVADAEDARNDACLDEPYICRPKTWCPFGGEGNVRCAISSCGTGKCPGCPFGGNLVFKSWCAYNCIRDSDKKLVGTAFMLLTVFSNYNGPWCVKL